MEFLTVVKEYILSIGDSYGVNPVIFAGIYVGAIPFFLMSVGWVIRNYKSGKSLVIPAISTVLFFTSSYIYLIIEGENVPIWVYGLIMAMIVSGAYSTVNKIRKGINSEDEPASP